MRAGINDKIQGNMTILVTGAAGFIGFHVARALLGQGRRVVGVDNMDAGYDSRLKQARLQALQAEQEFSFRQRDVADETLVDALAAPDVRIESIVHLAALSAVRQSVNEPFAYGRSNLHGHLVMCELARRLHENGRLRHFVFASSSSVYGGNEQFPARIEDAVERPLSLYAASKRCNEVVAQAYARLFAMPATGLRFFTVYGPWGRPDMALFQFTQAILQEREIVLFNHGDMERDFVYIDDIADGVLRALETPTQGGEVKLYNLGSGRVESLRRMVAVLEESVGRKALVRLAPLQPGDPQRSSGEITASTRDLGFAPKVGIDEGIPRSVAWYREFYGI